ncbi:MAG: ferredoxin [Thermoprotei archaeon]|nr:MAG: ferredoxin [Thermoprotei archaeon]RLE99838.1 MAG: ferredoxin [Thermoprotei archaeon]HDI75469.1 4Fe-4S dicluster domain-containing protein [Thermoprotei archaeon]
MLKGWKEIPIGGMILEPGNSVNFKTGDWRAMKPVIDKSKCVKCLMCWTLCPEPAIIRHDDNSVDINYDFCKGCGICAKICPRKAITMVPEGGE